MIRWFTGFWVLVMVAALFAGGARPEAAGLIPVPWDKLAHAAYFFWLTFLLFRFVGMPLRWVIVLVLLVGAADEFHQSFLPGRVAGWDDWLADAVGTALGLLRFKRKPGSSMWVATCKVGIHPDRSASG